MLLDELALPALNARMIEEINSSRDFYSRIDYMSLLPQDKIQYKKKIINDSIFDMFVGYFDLGYDLKLKFNKEEKQDAIYVNINNSFDEIFYKVYIQCFYMYLSKSHMLKDNKIDENIYKIARMAIMNKDKKVLKKIANNSYLEFIKLTEIYSNLSYDNISVEEVNNLKQQNSLRRKLIIENMEELKINSRLSFDDIRLIYSCFSNFIYTKLNNKQRAHLADLLYNYFSDNNSSNYHKYLKLLNKSVKNKQCLEIIINDLLIKGDSITIKRKNMDMIKRVLSGIPYIYKNEFDKSNLNSLDDIYKSNKNSKK